MKHQVPPRVGTPHRVVLIGAAVGAMVALILALDAALAKRAAPPAYPSARPMASPGEPIAAEAHVFRTRPGDLAADAAAGRRSGAHPRTLATFRALRAFPGAPPRVPHGLTAEEFRTTGCNTCHERGGYSARFAAYTPVTPHPEFRDCLQCHLADDPLVGITFPAADPDAICRQCHTPGATPANPAPLNWRAPAWPGTGQQAMPGSPPLIPHDLQLRGNCLACHMGPGAVEEIRTFHPERANCRQCHVPAAPGDGVFARHPQESTGQPAGGR